MSDPAEKQKLKRLVNVLKSYRGSATSMITLTIAPGTQLSQVNNLINDEKSSASNVKCRVNRQSILSALESITQRLKLYTRCPENGLIIYCGESDGSDGNKKKITLDIVPPRPINTKGYDCGNSFDTSVLESTLLDNVVYGFIIIDGSGVLFAKLDGNHKEVLPNSFTVDLPNKHGRGGQSALRFSRLRMEKRHNYVTKVCEEAIKCFITNDLPNVKGIVLAGLAEFKHIVKDTLDPRLQKIIVTVLDIAYSNTNGLKQAIELSADKLTGLKLYDEITIINKFFEHIQLDTGLYVYGQKSIDALLGCDAIQTLILWEDYEGKYRLTDEKDQVQDVDYMDWILDNYQKYGFELKLISNKSQEGEQFIKGFSGIGAILRYVVDDPHDIDDRDNDNATDTVNYEDLPDGVDLDDYM